MNDFFMPLYMNADTIAGFFKIAVERYINITSVTNREDFLINTNLPLSQLTCGKILQGTAFVQYGKSFTTRDIEAIEKSYISVYFNLISLLNENKMLKTPSKATSINTVKPGDIIEFQCTMRQNSLIEKFKNLVNMLEIDAIIEDSKAITKQEDFKGTNAKILLQWLKPLLNEIKESKCTKYVTSPLFNEGVTGIIPVTNKYMLSDLDCIENTTINIVGKISNKSINDNLKPKLSSSGRLMSINKTLSEILNEEQKKRYDIASYKEEEINNYIEIVPLMISI